MEMDIRPNGDRLEVIVRGSLAAGDFGPGFADIFAACAEHRVRRVLVDGRAADANFSTLDRFQFGADLSEAYFRYISAGAPPVLMAFLGREPLVEPQRLGETVAVNRGVAVKVTTDLAEAERFLSDPPATP